MRFVTETSWEPSGMFVQNVLILLDEGDECPQVHHVRTDRFDCVWICEELNNEEKLSFVLRIPRRHVPELIKRLSQYAPQEAGD